jgi:hypothetical protein
VLHLRILVLADPSQSVEALLLGELGAVHVSVVVGASRDPSGDLIETDVVRAALGPMTRVRRQPKRRPRSRLASGKS